MRFLFLLLILAQTACAQTWERSSTEDGFAPALLGTWQSHGYGWVLDIQPDSLTIYASHDAGCTQVETTVYMEGPLQMYAPLDQAGNNLLLSFREANSTRYRISRIDAVPEACLTPPRDDPQSVFDYTWSVMNEQYAFLDLYEVDWAARYAALAPTITETTSDAALFDALVALLEGIEDAHLTLNGDVDGTPRRHRGRPAPVLGPVLREAFAAQDTTSEDYVDTMGGFSTQWYFGNRDAIREDLLGGVYETAGGGNVFWGRLGGPDGQIGYVNIAGMDGFAEEMEEGEDADMATEITAVHTVMSTVITDLADTDALVVDVVLNQGGYDEISLAIAAHFAEKPTLGLTKYAQGAEATTRQSFTVIPAEKIYTKPVVLLTSDVTVSAAETFTMEMRALPQVTHAGAATRGALSDMLFRSLPNGWQLTLSNEVYLDAEGKLWERIGIPPEQSLPMFAGGIDGHLDALRILAQQLTSMHKTP